MLNSEDKLKNNLKLTRDEKYELLLRAEKNNLVLENYHDAWLAQKNGYSHLVNEEIIPEKALINLLCKSKLDSNVVLFPEQYNVLKKIEEGNLIFLSAPTSFGKTFLVLEHIKRKEKEYTKIVYLVPTLALKDELEIKISKNFKKYMDKISTDKSFFIILTFEEALKIVDEIKEVDILVIDEVYKLGEKSSENNRVLTMNYCYYKMKKISRKIVLLAPFIKEIKTDDSFIQIIVDEMEAPTAYKVENIVVSSENRERVVLEKIKNNKEECISTLVYLNSPKKCATYVNRINNDFFMQENKEILLLEKWIEENISKEWSVYKAIQRGVGVHHGNIPAFIKKATINQFQKGNIPIMLCTTTLVEGINTTCKEVLIPELTVISDKQRMSFFQYKNLSGRVARLGTKNLTGKIFMYDSEPFDEENEEFVPLELWAETEKKESDADSFNKEYVKESAEIQENMKQYDKLMKVLKSLNLDKDFYDKHFKTTHGIEKFINFIKKYKKNKDIFKQLRSEEIVESWKFEMFLNIWKNIFTVKVKGFYHQESGKYMLSVLSDLMHYQNYKSIFIHLSRVNNNDYYKELSIDEKLGFVIRARNAFENVAIPQLLLLEDLMHYDKDIPNDIKKLWDQNFFYIIKQVEYNKVKSELYDKGICDSLAERIEDAFENNRQTKNFYEALRTTTDEIRGGLSEIELLNLKIILDEEK